MKRKKEMIDKQTKKTENRKLDKARMKKDRTLKQWRVRMRTGKRKKEL